MSSLSPADRVRGALWGIFLADALSMPVHWFYNVGEIDRRFGRVVKYHAPSNPHPSSIMNLASVSAGGRSSGSSSSERSIVGDIILKGKRQFWGQPGMHYHHGMRAGENTLNAQCARLVMRGITANGGRYSGEKFLEDYVAFMTTEGTHNDTYAESYHRDFFSNFARGIPPAQCCGAEKHDTPSVGAVVTLPPVIFSSLADGPEATVQNTLQHLHWTHRSASLDKYVTAYTKLLMDVIAGGDLREGAVAAGRSVGVDILKLMKIGERDDRAVVGSSFSTACYISDSMPAVLFLAYKYADNPQAGIVANTNCGGENCHRGSALGALLGAAHGTTGFESHMYTDLVAKAEIEREIDAFIRSIRI